MTKLSDAEKAEFRRGKQPPLRALPELFSVLGVNLNDAYCWVCDIDGCTTIHETQGEADLYLSDYGCDCTASIYPLFRLGGDEMNDRVTLRLGPLAALLAAHCERHGTTPSDVIRAALAANLRVAAPAMEGHVETIKRVNAAKRTKRRGRRGSGMG